MIDFIDREINLCLGCMDVHVVYKVFVEGVMADYCFKTDTFLIDIEEYSFDIEEGYLDD